MPKKTIGNPPFPPVVPFDENREFTLDDLSQIALKRPEGVTLCIRPPAGPPDRGGYFFHLVPPDGGNSKFRLYDFEKKLIADFGAVKLVAFMNHCTGQRFDQRSFERCQNELNFLKDSQPDA